MPLLRHLRLRNDHQAEFASKTTFLIIELPASRIPEKNGHDSSFSEARRKAYVRSNHTYINFDDLPFLYNAKARLRILGLLQWPPSLQFMSSFSLSKSL